MVNPTMQQFINSLIALAALGLVALGSLLWVNRASDFDIWSIGEILGSLVIRLGKLITRISKAGRYAWKNYRAWMVHLRMEEEA
jgi:hypothetical protein